MLNDSLVSINIYNEKTGEIKNKNEYIPILFYWDGNNSLENSIINNDEFIDNYINKIDNNELLYIRLAYFYFRINENNEEEYIQYNKSLIDIIKENNSLNNIYKDFIGKYIIKYFIKGYLISFEREYKVNNELSSIDNIKDIWNQIHNKYQEKLSKNTFINWIRKEMINENIENNNIEFIINFIENILN